jgi:septum site-determining protein MinD
VLNDLKGMGFDYIVCDSPAGIETGALMAMHFADEALVVTNPEVSSVRDSDRILGMLSSKTQRAIEGGEPIKEHLLITRYNPNRVADGQMLSLEDIQDILRIPLIGVIPESESVLQASNQGLPAVHMKGTEVAEAYQDVVARFLGEDKPMRFTEAHKPGFFKRILAHERVGRNAQPDYLVALQRDLVAVISKYVAIDPNDIKVHLERQDNLEVLEVKIELPEAAR